MSKFELNPSLPNKLYMKKVAFKCYHCGETTYNAINEDTIDSLKAEIIFLNKQIKSYKNLFYNMDEFTRKHLNTTYLVDKLAEIYRKFNNE